MFPRRISIGKICPLQSPALLSYLQSRYIAPAVASAHCREVPYTVGGRAYFVVGFRNDADGWELRNARLKGCSSPKRITTFDNGSDTVLVFEGFMDFLSYLTLKKTPRPAVDSAVLNSVVNLSEALPFLQRHRTIHAFLDNDGAGHAATEGIVHSCTGSDVVDQSYFYWQHKDLNKFLQARNRQPGNERREVMRPQIAPTCQPDKSSKRIKR
ncbi:toprim domain-containing protein [Alistipes indistinctus]|uniref:toprim domain-containing protein n=1 Tax=Alistipes indistinctus TaxID=626932 RepID=UPI00241E10F6|nr:toprim domain-containing protein [Alistipes indistinctus]